MIITISSDDIQLIRQNLKENPHKGPIVLDKTESTLIGHDNEESMLPFSTDIIPPSEADIDTCLVNNTKNWMLINQDGIWVYSVATVTITSAIIKSIKAIVAVSVEDYIYKMSRLAKVMNNWIGITVKLYPYEYISMIILKTHESFDCGISDWLKLQSSA